MVKEHISPGDIVIDREDGGGQDSYSPMYVLVVSNVKAAEKEVHSNKTVADMNEKYPEDDRVVRVAYESGLDDAYGTAWRKHIFDDLPAWVEQTRQRTGSYPQVYDFPESRLVQATLEVNIVPGENPSREELDKLKRRLARFIGDLDEVGL